MEAERSADVMQIPFPKHLKQVQKFSGCTARFHVASHALHCSHYRIIYICIVY